MATDDLDDVLEAVAQINIEAGRLLVYLLDGVMSPADEVSLGNVFAKAGQALKRHGRERQAQATGVNQDQDGTISHESRPSTGEPDQARYRRRP